MARDPFPGVGNVLSDDQWPPVASWWACEAWAPRWNQGRIVSTRRGRQQAVVIAASDGEHEPMMAHWVVPIADFRVQWRRLAAPKGFHEPA